MQPLNQPLCTHSPQHFSKGHMLVLFASACHATLPMLLSFAVKLSAPAPPPGKPPSSGRDPLWQKPTLAKPLTVAATGQNISMSLIDWRIGSTSMRHSPAAAPGPAPTAAPAPVPALAPAAGPLPGPAPGPGTPGPPLPLGEAPGLDSSTPFFLGGVTAESSAMQANANITVVDVPVRAICMAASNSTFGATLELAVAHRSELHAVLLQAIA